MSATVEVRRATEADLPAVLRLQQRTAEAPHWREAHYRELLLDEGGFGLRRQLIVAQEGAEVVGFVAVSAVAGEAELEFVVVDSRLRRQGVGRVLCEAAIQWAKQAGVARMLLEVRQASVGAQALYRSLGFETVGVRAGYYADPSDDAVQMAAVLDGRNTL